MESFTVTHVSTYRYANPVTFGDHRLMFRPRDSHDMRLVHTSLSVTPPPTSLRWVYDVYGNSIAIASFGGTADTLSFVSEIELEHYGVEQLPVDIEPYAKTYPFSYSAEELPDLGRLSERQYPDPEHLVDEWTKEIVANVTGPDGKVETWALLRTINSSIKQHFTYQARYEEGTQNPADTLKLRSGTCRDYALLFMEVARGLGLAAKFVTGYIYTPSADDPTRGPTTGACNTHAWAQVYLPGPGWVDFDPTNDLIGGTDLIRVAVVRDPTQAVPLAGTYTGTPGDFLGMEIDVRVSRKGNTGNGGG